MTDAQRTPTGRIFISYRRQDSAYPAGWLYDRLAEQFGAEQVFKDVDSIELGDDFVDVITHAVGSCDVLLALIGRKWLRITGQGRVRRLDDPNDFVRLEIEAALDRKVMLIPILVDGATMPRSDELPSSISALVRRHALELSPNRFRADTDHLLEVMERTLSDLQDEQTVQAPPVASSVAAPPPDAPPDDPPAAEPRPERSRRSFGSRWVLAAAAVAALAVLAAVIVNALSDDPRNPASSPTKAATSPATPTPLGGAGGPIVVAHRGGAENYAWQTLPAFRDAAKAGAVVETDVRWTQDGVAVLVHDTGTTPGMECTGGSYVVAETTWPVLRDRCRSPAAASTNGKRYGIPTFSDTMSALSQVPGAQIFPEVKVVQNSTQVRQFLAMVENVRMTDRTVVTSTKAEELAKIHARAEKDGVDIRMMQFVSKQRVPAANLADNLWGVAVQVDIATAAYVKDLQGEGLKVMIWTVNKPAQWKEVNRLGADLVMTDEPEAYGEWAANR